MDFDFFPGLAGRCDLVGLVGKPLIAIWDDAIEGSDEVLSGLLEKIDAARSMPLGDALVDLLGSDNEALAHHRESLNEFPDGLRKIVVDAAYEAARKRMPLAIDFGFAFSTHSAKVATVYHDEPSVAGLKLEVYVPRHPA